MNREDIIRMAREAGMPPVEITSDKPVLYPAPDAIERFAALVAAAEREKVAAWMIQRSYATGHGDTTEDLLKELDWQIDERIAAEREACAKVADSISEDQWALYKGRPPYTGQELERASDYTQGKSDGAEICAYAIRARKNT